MGRGAGAPRGAMAPRGGERPSPSGCRSSLKKLGAARPRRRQAGREQPRQRRGRPALPDGLRPASETERCTNAETSGGTPSSDPPAPNLADLGRSAVRARLPWRAGQLRGGRTFRPPGGDGEALRGSRGEAAGE
jgi:hypothetical protein